MLTDRWMPENVRFLAFAVQENYRIMERIPQIHRPENICKTVDFPVGEQQKMLVNAAFYVNSPRVFWTGKHHFFAVAIIGNVRVSNANLFICHSSKCDGNLMQVSWFSSCLLRFTDSVKILIFKGSKTTANKCENWKFTLVAKLTQTWCKFRVYVTFAPNFSRSKCVSLLRRCRLCKFVTNLEP